MLVELMKNGKKNEIHKIWCISDIEDPENNSIMRRPRGNRKLTDYMNYIGNIRASDSEID